MKLMSYTVYQVNLERDKEKKTKKRWVGFNCQI